jgi:hypothetical protein
MSVGLRESLPGFEMKSAALLTNLRNVILSPLTVSPENCHVLPFAAVFLAETLGMGRGT